MARAGALCHNGQRFAKFRKAIRMAKKDSKQKHAKDDELPKKNPATKSVKVKRDAEPAKKQQSTKAFVKEKLAHGGKIVFVVVACLAMLLSVGAIALSGVISVFSDDDTDYELTGGIAATVEGVNITEDTITEYIMEWRESYGYEDDDDWAEYLADYSYTPEDFRAEIIDDYIEDLLISLAIKEYGIEVSDEDVEAEWDEIIETSYDGDEDTFVTILETYLGYDKESYLELLEESLQEEALTEAVAPAEDVDDDEVLAVVNEETETYGDTKRSSHILISVDDTDDEDELAEALATAEEALEAIESGEMTFEEAAAEYSDDSSADDGGDVGWDSLSSFVTEYQDALDALELDEMTAEPVLSDYGYHIILCTDEYQLPEDGETDVDNLPDEIYESIVEDIQDEQVDEDYAAWYEEYYASADIEIFDMPEDVPYNVDMSDYEDDSTEEDAEDSEDEDTEDADSTDEESTDETDDGDSETDDSTSDDDDSSADDDAEEDTSATADDTSLADALSE